LTPLRIGETRERREAVEELRGRIHTLPPPGQKEPFAEEASRQKWEPS